MRARNPPRGDGRAPTRSVQGIGQGARRGRVHPSSRSSNRLSARAEQASKVQKLKLSFKTGGSGDSAFTRKTSFLGEYDRELDENPDDPLAFEEQFILRAPREVADGKDGLRELIKGKGKGLNGIEFKFLGTSCVGRGVSEFAPDASMIDSRRAAFKVNGVTYSSKLVDLPCIVESQKTHDSRHLFKVADISQVCSLSLYQTEQDNEYHGRCWLWSILSRTRLP